MRITLSPVRLDTPMTLQRHGDVLTINGEEFDFGGLPEGAVLPAVAVASPMLAGDVTRVSGVLSLTLILPHGAMAPQDTLFPDLLILTGDGPVDLPPYEVTDEH
jgi:hypothetical protein